VSEVVGVVGGKTDEYINVERHSVESVVAVR
jgi:hypothetical protein